MRVLSGSSVANWTHSFCTSWLNPSLRTRMLRMAEVRRFDHEQQADWLVDFDHLPGEAGTQVAGGAVHDAQQTRDVVRKL